MSDPPDWEMPQVIIDAHTHAFMPEDLEILVPRLAMLDACLHDDDPNKWRLRTGGTVEELAEACQKAGVDRFVLLPVTGRTERVGGINRWAAQVAAQNPAIIPFGNMHPRGDMVQDLDEVLDLGLKGLKLHPFVQRFGLEDPETVRLMALLADSGLPVVLDTIHPQGVLETKPHVGTLLAGLGFSGVTTEQTAAVARRHPELRLILAHGGSLYGWDFVDPLFELDNVYFDLAYLNGIIEPSRVVEMIRRKGPERVIYGSDAPWREPSDFRQWFEELGLTTWEREMVEAGTLLEILG